MNYHVCNSLVFDRETVYNAQGPEDIDPEQQILTFGDYATQEMQSELKDITEFSTICEEFGQRYAEPFCCQLYITFGMSDPEPQLFAFATKDTGSRKEAIRELADNTYLIPHVQLYAADGTEV